MGMRNRSWIIAAAAVLLLLLAGIGEADDKYSSDRERMVRYQIELRGVKDKRVLAAMREVPRHLFVPERIRGKAYEDHPLPIGLGQTISQPYIVAFMTELLKLKPEDKVFELGTGSAYQAAVASKVAAEVYTVEIYGELATKAGERLEKLGFNNVHAREGDGYYGWPEAAPFDAIIVTAAADHIPPPLIRQLKPGGRLVIPLGSPFTVQQLVMVTKDEAGKVDTRPIIAVRFVPLLGH
jgi:protein-L-isoaspartate(D-aspartate) O-methyltransferase